MTLRELLKVIAFGRAVPSTLPQKGGDGILLANRSGQMHPMRQMRDGMRVAPLRRQMRPSIRILRLLPVLQRLLPRQENRIQHRR